MPVSVLPLLRQKNVDLLELSQIIECAEYIESESDQVVDADGLYVIPGLIDVHSHGAAGYNPIWK